MSADRDLLDAIRILVTDDNAAIHEDFRRILAKSLAADAKLSLLKACCSATWLQRLCSRLPTHSTSRCRASRPCNVSNVRAKRAAVRHRVRRHAHATGLGWLETIERLWEKDPDVQIVICSAHSDYD